MKFAHMADCHIGAWRDQKLKDLPSKVFEIAIDKCIQEKVDFVLISGDLFNTSLPGIDYLKHTVKELKKLKEKNINVYMIAGSHDFSPSGKTIIDVLEEAGLVINVVKGYVEENKLFLKFTEDKKTGAKITGLLGRRGTLEKKYYELLDTKPLESETGFKIFMFHTAITDIIPKELAQITSSEMSFMPKKFNYYAGGHVHIIKEFSNPDYKNVIYPGPLFPANFSELEKLNHGGFYIYENETIKRIPIKIKDTVVLEYDCDNKSPEEIIFNVEDLIKKHNLKDKIVLLRLYGKLKFGKVTDIDFKELFKKIYDQNAYFILKNTSKLTSEEFEEIKLESKNIESLEEEIVREHLGQVRISGFNNEKELELSMQLLYLLNSEKHEGEKLSDYESRIKKDIDKILDLY